MRDRYYVCLLLVIVVAIARTSTDAQQAKSPAQVVQTSADLAVAIAQSGYAGGVVLTLPTHLSAALLRERNRTNAFLTTRSAFGVWLRNDASPGNERLLLPTSADAEAAMSRIAGSTGLTVTHWRNTPAYLLKAPSAGVCLAALRNKLPEAVSSRNVVDLITAAVRVATRTKVPGGYIGSCIGTNDFRPEPVSLPAGEALEDALSWAVATFGSSVWAAVQDEQGQCSVGVIRRAERGGICMTAVTATLQPER
jgi:hypothetical protein